MPDYVAPAAKALTVLHIRNPRPANPAMAASPPADGETLCGMPMEAAGLWQVLGREPGDRVCGRCEDPGSDEGDQGTLL